MANKKVRRSEAAHRRKMSIIWFASLFFLMLLVVLEVVIVYNQVHPVNRALSEEVDYSKIHFEGLALGDEISPEIINHPIIDAVYDYSWRNISIAVDENKTITRLGFFATESVDADLLPDSVTIKNTTIDYRYYPLTSISDFVTYFGYTKITNFDHYKYLTYQDDRYIVNVVLYDGDIRSIELSKRQS